MGIDIKLREVDNVYTNPLIIELAHDSDDIKEQIMEKKDQIMEIVGEELASCSKVLIEQVNGKIVIYELKYVD